MSQLDQLRQALQASPDNLPLLQLLAEACLSEFSIEEALSHFEKIIRLDAKNSDAILGVAKTWFMAGQISEAVVRVEAYLKQSPNHPGALLLLSRFLLADGDRPQATRYYEQAVQIQPSLRDPLLEKNLALAESSTAPKSDPLLPRAIQTDAGIMEETDLEFATEDSSDLGSEFEKPTITFAQVGGMDLVKEEIRMKIIHPVKNPDLFKAYGKKSGGGVLLYGPPGCGKTLLSRATAGEMKAGFFAIGIHQILDLYIGNSEKNLHEIFEVARRNAPCVLFFDEVDALAADRNDFKKNAGRTLINQFLAEMDGTTGDNEGVLVLGATNAPWHIDPAFRRPGRFDRILFIPPPDETARESILQLLARDKPVDALDFKAIAKKTKDLSGADLKSIFDLATERTLAQAMKDGRIIPLTQAEILKAVKEIKPSTRAWFESARNYAIYSNQGGFYDDILKFLGIQK